MKTSYVVVWNDLAERQRRVLLQSSLLRVDGHLEMVDGVRHVIAGRLSDLTALLTGLDVRSRDFSKPIPMTTDRPALRL